ncbi:sigma-70 family RNA polymerase sigma factor [Solirubrobacter sp. CPCC 204708]|uniref:Sigma-70 family RNA polymerase sigma factor n=1 Tax=Solirubrobacter deserti TaxID=2282478 RepID=A0ABT4RS76_9ACTN|nr:sigma-70 family RNA polymerase sigma factor [Solirubrobacter deserti]MBE2314348.1 sigma-70 family RNA polymerase sigma factor [Solirubrobacter deserti]MDA0141446.1 sigma-70 family RNA polymerase sigma factor [Solirubrobacter deserti]
MASQTDPALRALTLATRTAVAMLGPGDEAHDVAQEVALRVLERRRQLRDPEKFDAWVHRIAVRETLRAQRKRTHRRRAEAPLDETSEALAAAAIDLDGQLDAAAFAREALSRLGERERLVLVLRYVHDLPDSQIAAILDCRRGTVNSLLSRARDRMRAMPIATQEGGAR